MPTEEPIESYRPDQLRWREHQDGMGDWRFEHTPSRMQAVGTLLFAIVWNGFLAFWYAIAFKQRGGPGAVMLWFPVIHVSVGVWLTYAAIAGLLNHTTFSIDRQMFRLTKGPVPQRGGLAMPLTNIDRFSANEESVQTKNGVTLKAQVLILTHDKRSIVITLALTHMLEARYVAGRLNHALDERRTPLTHRG
jgi:hypothetical protein